MFKKFWIYLKVYGKKYYKKWLIRLSIVLNIILLFSIIKFNFNIAMTQNQSQVVHTAIRNINNNQNVNLNMFYSRYTGNKKLIYSYIVYEGIDTYKQLDSFQIMFSKFVKGFILYPEIVSKADIVFVSYTNSYTNFSLKKATNKTIFGLFK